MAVETNALFYGDNLVWLRDQRYFPDESIDLIYLDPPFNSKADYNLIFNEPNKAKSQAQIKAFDDTWNWDSNASAIALNELAQNRPQVAELVSWLSKQGRSFSSIAAYLSIMAVRLLELHRILKPSGSLYLHCDPTASHYLKLVLDQVFGVTNFRNEIAWCYRAGGIPRKGYPSKHDILLFYTKGKEFTFNHEYIPYTEGTLQRGLTKVKGKYFAKGLRAEGTPIQDWWVDIPKVLSPTAREMLGYPTQKPLSLLERIIRISSDEGNVLLDPFCGCGTTIVAAQGLKRYWLGIDVTWLAIDLIEKRLKATYGTEALGKYEIHGKPYDMASAEALAKKSKKEFEIWAISLVGAAPREHDGGVDGIFGFVEKDKEIRTIIVQVKGGDALNPGMVRDLIGTVKKEGAAIGLLVTLREPSDGMKALAVHSDTYKSELWDKGFPSIQIRTVNELLTGKGFDLPPTQSPLKTAKFATQKGQQTQAFG